jgi:succinate dehydrogenase hydrophobic anchor subunit
MESHKVMLIITGILLTVILIMSIIIMFQIRKGEYNGVIFASTMVIIIIVILLLIIIGYVSRTKTVPLSYESYYTNL